jgi:hypothetical protein
MKKLLLLAVALIPVLASAQVNTCVGTISLTYFDPPGRPLDVGDVLHVRGAFGTGLIVGGTAIAYNKFQFDLDCNLAQPLVPPCTDFGPIISYAGDATITTDCGVTWTSNNPTGGFLPNQVEFDASPPLLVPPNIANPPGFCTVGFDVTVEAVPATLAVGEIIGYQIAFCNNGLTSGNFQTAAATFAQAQQHYDCYETPRSNIPAQLVTVVDRFGTTQNRVVTIQRLCAPADKNGETPDAPLDPLHYASADYGTTAGFTKVSGVSAITQFGMYTMDVVQPSAILLPASKGLQACVAPLQGEHFQCYKLRNVKGPAPKGVIVRDQFVGPFSIDINPRGPDRLCVSAQKNGQGTLTSNAFLCLRTRNDKLPFGAVDACLTTQFGQKHVSATQFDELCVPATIQ